MSCFCASVRGCLLGLNESGILSGNVQRLLIRIPHAYFIHFPRKPKRIMIIYAECDIQVMHRHRSCLESVLLSRTYINVLIYIHIFFFL